MLINYLFMENIPIDINNLLYLMRYYCFFITNLLFCCNITMMNSISNNNFIIDMNNNLMKNYLISNGVYIIDYIIIGNTKYINLEDYYNYYNIPILIFKLLIIYNIINLKITENQQLNLENENSISDSDIDN